MTVPVIPCRMASWSERTIGWGLGHFVDKRFTLEEWYGISIKKLIFFLTSIGRLVLGENDVTNEISEIATCFAPWERKPMHQNVSSSPT